MLFDANNGKTNWNYDEILELNQIYNIYPFHSLGHANSSRIRPDHTKIQVNLIYEYKQDGKYRACMVASSNMNGPNLDTY